MRLVLCYQEVFRFCKRHNLLIKLQPWLTFLWTTFSPCFILYRGKIIGTWWILRTTFFMYIETKIVRDVSFLFWLEMRWFVDLLYRYLMYVYFKIRFDLVNSLNKYLRLRIWEIHKKCIFMKKIVLYTNNV